MPVGMEPEVVWIVSNDVKGVAWETGEEASLSDAETSVSVVWPNSPSVLETDVAEVS